MVCADCLHASLDTPLRKRLRERDCGCEEGVCVRVMEEVIEAVVVISPSASLSPTASTN